jgi:hypothetical protein
MSPPLIPDAADSEKILSRLKKQQGWVCERAKQRDREVN